MKRGEESVSVSGWVGSKGSGKSLGEGIKGGESGGLEWGCGCKSGETGKGGKMRSSGGTLEGKYGPGECG